jgi:glycopeptide antibiotics resistance protein
MRLVCIALALLFLALAAYGSLVPLRFSPMPLADAIEQFRHVEFIPLHRASRSDLVANVLLLLPFGFFAAGTLVARARPPLRLAVVPLIALIGAAAATAIELGQVYTHSRTPSWNDVFGQTIGAALGAMCWAALGPRTLGVLRGIVRSPSSSDRAIRLLAVYAAIWALLGVLPLDFTIRPAELAKKYRAGRIALYTPWANRSTVQIVADVGATILWAAPIGALFVLVARRQGWPPAAGVLSGMLAGASLEAAQVFVYSRTAEASDAAFGAAGAAIGAAIATRLAAGWRVPAHGYPRWHLWPIAVLALWCGVLIVRHWAPFNFAFEREVFDRRWPRLWAVPFSSYYWAMPLDALSEALRKVVMAVPVGVLPMLAWPRVPGAGLWVRLALVTLVAGVIFFGIELGQVVLPGRFPDGTDVLLGVFGSLAGALFVWIVSAPRVSRQQAATLDAADARADRPSGSSHA